MNDDSKEVRTRIPKSILSDFTLNAETGELFWTDLTKHKSRRSGALGSLTPAGYRKISYRGLNLFAHRIVFFMTHGFCPPTLDHIDGDKDNNRPDNLREATQTTNKWNRKTRQGSKLGIGGLDLHAGYYRARLTADGQTQTVMFKEKWDAICWRKSAELKMFGTFRRGA